jgi:hypothetical protein
MCPAGRNVSESRRGKTSRRVDAGVDGMSIPVGTAVWRIKRRPV